jgi:parvulin-like peptidyl-prolyl isomerase
MRQRRALDLFVLAVALGVVAILGCRAAERPDLVRPKLPGPKIGSEQAAAAVKPVSRAQAPTGSTFQPLELGPEAPGQTGARGARIRAVVNNEAILEEEVLAAAYQQLIGVKNEKERAEILNTKLNEIIDRELLLQDARARLMKNGGKRMSVMYELEKVGEKEFERNWLYRLMKANNQSDPEQFKATLRENGMPYDLLKRQWVRSFIAMEYCRTKIDPAIQRVGNVEITEYYDKHPEEFKVEESIVWQDIFIAAARHPNRAAAKAFAESLIARLRSGEDFIRLCKEFDNGDSLFRENCEGIGQKKGEILPREVEPVLEILKNGEVGSLVEMDAGFHIVRMKEHVQAGQMPFDEKTQKLIREKLRSQIFQQEMKRMVNDLRSRAIIEIATQIK